MNKLIERFWSKVDKTSNPNGCWIWCASKDRNGYGMFWNNDKTLKAHRFSYNIHNGPFDQSLHICHTCDNPSCVNPQHLWLGTPADNAKDRTIKNRGSKVGNKGKCKGSRNGNSKLTEEQVREIKTKQFTPQEYAVKYNVTPETIHYIWAGKTWRHI